ncbi:MAG: hypothetical protein ACK5N8_06900 [Alphaproteobacteria bacterium]
MTKKKTSFIGLLLVLVILVGFLSFFYYTLRNGEITKELFTTSDIIRKEFKNKPGYWGLDNKFIIEKNLINNVNENRIVNGLGKNVIIGKDFEGYKVMPGERTFDVTYIGLNQKECINLVAYELQESQKISLVSVKVKNIEKVVEFSWDGENKLPISIDSAKIVCKNNQQNDILWTFE